MSFERYLITRLLDKYSKSVLSREGSERNICIKIDLKDPVLKSYTGRDSYKFREQNDEVIRKLENLGFIEATYNKSGELQHLVLNDEMTDELYSYAGMKNPKKENEMVREILMNHPFEGFMLDFKRYIMEYMEAKYTIPKLYFSDAEDLKVLLVILDAMLHLTEETMKRDFSVSVLGDSKKFTEYENKIIRIIMDFDPQAEGVPKEDILATYNIVSNYTVSLLKNKLTFRIRNTLIDLNQLPYDFPLTDKMIKDMMIVPSGIRKVITVENLTTFYMLKDDDALIIFLSGFHNSIKQSLLKKIYASYPDAAYYHFSDIDAGGFWIFETLKEKTGIPFLPYRMDKGELIANEGHLKSLSENDRKRLTSLLSDKRFACFHDTIRYMLQKGVKLEQEILD